MASRRVRTPPVRRPPAAFCIPSKDAKRFWSKTITMLPSFLNACHRIVGREVIENSVRSSLEPTSDSLPRSSRLSLITIRPALAFLKDRT
jgi:hypothetical protein